MSWPIKPGDMAAWDRWERRVEELEAEGMTRSDAQGVADAEWINRQVDQAEHERDMREGR